MWLCGCRSDVGSRDSLTADEDDYTDADDDNDDDADADDETEGQSSEDEDGGDIDELLDEALDKDMEENNVQHADDKPSLTKDAAAAAAAQPVSYSW